MKRYILQITLYTGVLFLSIFSTELSWDFKFIIFAGLTIIPICLFSILVRIENNILISRLLVGREIRETDFFTSRTKYTIKEMREAALDKKCITRQKINNVIVFVSPNSDLESLSKQLLQAQKKDIPVIGP